MTRFLTLLSTLLILAVQANASTFGSASIYDELTPDQQAAIQKGEKVTLTQEVENSYWPRITIFQRIEGTPEEGAAVYADYARHNEFIPKLAVSEISSQVDNATQIVDYRMDINFFVSIEYTSKNHVASYDNGQAYQIKQDLVNSDDLYEMALDVRFEPLGTGAILRYEMLVSPKSSMSASFSDRAVAIAQDAGQALGRRIVNERLRDQDLLQQEIESLRKALDPTAKIEFEPKPRKCWFIFCLN